MRIANARILQMAKPPRIEFAGSIYQIRSCGNQWEAIFEEDEDQERFLGVLAEAVERYNWSFHAYCLMTNHFKAPHQ